MSKIEAVAAEGKSQMGAIASMIAVIRSVSSSEDRSETTAELLQTAF